MKKQQTINLTEEEKAEHSSLKIGFDDYYVRKLVPFLRQKEAVRRKYVGMFWSLLFMSFIVLSILGGIFYFWGQYVDNNFGVIILLIICVMTMYLIRVPFIKYRKTLKNDFMEKFIRFFEGFSYRYGQSLNRGLMDRSLIFPSYDIIKVGDCFSGRYFDMGITVCEQTLQKHCEDSPRQKNLKTVFQGTAIEIDMKRPFSCQVAVLQDEKLLENLERVSDMKQLKIEDENFAKELTAYVTNEEESKKILIPSFMERLLNLKEVYKAEYIQVSFYANKILIGIQTEHNMFNPGSFFASNLRKKNFDRVLERIWSLFLVINTLKELQNNKMR